jgi:hypothetical protein
MPAAAAVAAAAPPQRGVDGALWQAIADVRALRSLTSPAGAAGAPAEGGGGRGAARTTALRLASTVDRQLARALDEMRAVAAAPPAPCGECAAAAAAAEAPSDLDRRLYSAIRVRPRGPREP